MKWPALGGAIVIEVLWSLALKAALAQPLWYVAVVVGYVSAFVLLAAGLRMGVAIGVAYGIWATSGVALTALGSAVVFGEPLSVTMLIGIAFIMGGVVCVENGSALARKREYA